MAKNYLDNYAYDKTNNLTFKSDVEVRCKRCHRVLKNNEAKLVGYGPSCYKKHLMEINNNRKKLF